MTDEHKSMHREDYVAAAKTNWKPIAIIAAVVVVFIIGIAIGAR